MATLLDRLAQTACLPDRTGGGAKVKADVITSHAPYMACQAASGNLVSGGED